MKKLLTLPNLLKCCAALFGLVAFVLMFTNQLYSGSSIRVYVAFDDALFGDGGAVISFIGYLLILLSSVAVCLFLFLNLDKKMVKLLNFILAAVFLLGAVFVFIEAAVVNGSYSVFKLTASPVIAGILAVLAGILVCASEFAPDKKLGK